MLAQQGSYTAAAQRLGVSKAAMSQRIAELEQAAGVPLVQRTTRSVRLTEAGQRLVDEHARAPSSRSPTASPACATWPACRAGWCA